MTLGQRIQQIRTEHGLSQEEFGERLGTTRQTVSKWELDKTYPEISKIVLMSRMFSVTTDSILVDGISTFETDLREFSCGVYRSARKEIAETEKFAVMYYCNSDKSVLGARLYMGFEDKKLLVAICERDQTSKQTRYAYISENKDIISNDKALCGSLGEIYDKQAKNAMRRLERFSVDKTGDPLPTVSEVGMSGCLTKWRMADSYFASPEQMRFWMCTGKTEYVFSICPKDDNIYCGASYNVVFELGMFGGGQFFRIRNYKDNSERFCRFHCDFSYEAPVHIRIPTEEVEIGRCVVTSKGNMWCVKRYTDDEIVLQGCGNDKYIYRRHDRANERFVK